MINFPNITSAPANHTVEAGCTPAWACHFPSCEEAIALADSLINKLNPFGELRDHNRALKELNIRRSRIRLISADFKKGIQEYRNLGCLTLKQTKEIEEVEKRCKSMAAVLTRLDEEINYVERDALLERCKKMGRFANLAVPCGGRIVGLSACAFKAAHVGYFSLFGQCASNVKSAKVQAVANQIAIEGAKILACTAFAFAVCYMYTCRSSS
ncbi:MAG: hypothetical protein LLG04_11545 [Parachlamydia sp.]|nr:hypothetical protein [Parachlamydia sp.]